MKITYSKNAIKFLKRQSKDVSERIIRHIEMLPFGDVKKMKNSSFYRLRVGKYRVIFDNNGTVIDVIEIDNRGQIYK